MQLRLDAGNMHDSFAVYHQSEAVPLGILQRAAIEMIHSKLFSPEAKLHKGKKIAIFSVFSSTLWIFAAFKVPLLFAIIPLLSLQEW